MLLSMVACGSDTAKEPAVEEASDAAEVVQTEAEAKPAKGGKASGGYESFDDLTKEWDVDSDFLMSVDDVEGSLYLRCDTPADFGIESLYKGFASYNSEYGVVVVSSGEYAPGGVDFSTVYHDWFLETLDDYEGFSDWLDFTPDTTETVTVNGREAIRFAGTQNVEDYGTPYSFEVYGYYVEIENVPVIIAAVSGELATVQSSDDMATIKHYADEMIYTLRALDHYEEY